MLFASDFFGRGIRDCPGRGGLATGDLVKTGKMAKTTKTPRARRGILAATDETPTPSTLFSHSAHTSPLVGPAKQQMSGVAMYSSRSVVMKVLGRRSPSRRSVMSTVVDSPVLIRVQTVFHPWLHGLPYFPRPAPLFSPCIIALWRCSASVLLTTWRARSGILDGHGLLAVGRRSRLFFLLPH